LDSSPTLVPFLGLGLGLETGELGLGLATCGLGLGLDTSGLEPDFPLA